MGGDGALMNPTALGGAHRPVVTGCGDMRGFAGGGAVVVMTRALVSSRMLMAL